MAPIRIPWFIVAVCAMCAGFSVPQASLAAQKGSWEIGLDLGAEFASRDIQDFSFVSAKFKVKEKTVEVPEGSFRAGYFITDALSLESSLGVSWLMENPDTHVEDWQVRAGLGATFAISPSSRVSPFLSSGVSTRNTTSSIVFGIPIEAGLRIRLGEVHSIRIQSGIVATFAPDQYFSEPDRYWTVPVRIGWSVDTNTASERTTE